MRVPRDQVQTVLVGWGKPGRPCYLRVVLPMAPATAVPNCLRPRSGQCRVLQAQVLGPSDTGVLLRRRFAWSAAARPVICLNASRDERKRAAGVHCFDQNGL